MYKKVILIVSLIFCFIICKAQNDSTFKPLYLKDVNYVVTTKIDIKYIGFIDEETEYSITLINRNTNVKTQIFKSEIKTIKPLSTIKRGSKSVEFYEPNDHCDYYILAPSGFLYEPQTVTTTYHWGAIENFNIPLNENVAITANALFIYPYSLGIKCAFKVSENGYLGGNIFGMGNILGQKPSDYFLGYGAKINFTQGTTNNNFTLAGGVLGLNGTIFTNTTQDYLNLYYANFGYCSRISNMLTINGEVWYFPESQTAFGGLGLKLVNDKESSWTFGCYTILNNFNNSFKLNLKTILIPYIGYSQSF